MYDDEEQEKDDLYLIPANVTARFEFFDGFGWHELFVVAIALVIGFCVFFITGIPQKTVINNSATSYINSNVSNTSTDDLNNEVNNNNNNSSQQTQQKSVKTKYKKVSFIPAPIRLLFVVFIGGITFMAVIKNSNTNMSVVEMFRSMKEFNNKQHRYLFIYRSGTEGK